MKIAITGASGFVGSALVAALEARGDEVLRLVRREAAGPSEVSWRPSAGEIDAAALEGVDGVVHLAGESVAGGLRWSRAKKRRIRDSRIDGTGLIASTVAALAGGPQVLVSASAIGLYGDRGDQLLSEDAEPGDDFLAEVALAWESAADPAREAGVRVVHPRIGVVLDPSGAALAKMLPAFKLGIAGRLGSGEQWMSWIALEDLVGLLIAALDDGDWSGPVNAVAPNPVTNAEFTETLGKALRRPTLLPAPAFALRLAMGEMADAILLASTRVDASKAVALGYGFRFERLADALASFRL